MFNSVDSYVCGGCGINHDKVVEISRTLELTAEEIVVTERADKEAANAAAAAAAKTSAHNKLAALGLTADEITALYGIGG